MKNYFRISILTICFFAYSVGYSQSYKKRQTNTFAASVIGGVNLSQMDGDESFGFDKVGMLGGIRGSILLSDRHQINIELLYSQKGSKLERQGVAFAGEEFIKVDYIEVPVVFQVYPKKNNGKAYFETGLYFARNIRATIEENVRDTTRFIVFEELAPEFNNFEVGALIGVGLRIKQRIGLGIRFSLGLSYLYKDNDFMLPPFKLDPVEPVYTLRNYNLSIFSAYHF